MRILSPFIHPQVVPRVFFFRWTKSKILWRMLLINRRNTLKLFQTLN